jgi:hypothetical protein
MGKSRGEPRVAGETGGPRVVGGTGESRRWLEEVGAPPVAGGMGERLLDGKPVFAVYPVQTGSRKLVRSTVQFSHSTVRTVRSQLSLELVGTVGRSDGMHQRLALCNRRFEQSLLVNRKASLQHAVGRRC